MDEQQLLEAIRKLTSTIESLSATLGVRTNRTGQTGGVNRNNNSSSTLDSATKNMSSSAKRLSQMMKDQVDASIAANRRLTKSELETAKAMGKFEDAVTSGTKATKELTEAERKARDAAEALRYANKSAAKSTGEFAKNLLVGGADLKTSLGSLGTSLGYAASKGNRLAGILATVAGGTAFTLSVMEEFAKNAAAVAGSVDLSAVNAGFITTSQSFSGLGQNFNKVLNESANSFKIFGGTTEDAINNLSRLSNGLRTGSVSTAITNRLGKDSARQFREAAKATANLGLTQEEQASLQASIMQQVRLNAKNEVDAQRMLVKQYTETVVSARNLSNSFGISAKEILKAIENFNKSTSGKAARRLNVKGSTEAMAMLQSMNLGLSEDQMQKMAVDIARGRAGDAATMVGDDPNAYNAVIALGESFQEAQRNGGVNDKTLREAMLRRRESVMGSAIGAGENGTGLGLSTGGKYAESFENLNDYFVRLAEGGKKAETDKAGKEKDGKTTETDNIKTMNTLTAALDSLKGAVNSLISAVYANTGAIGLLITSIAGAMLISKIAKGVMGGLATGAGSIFGKLAEKIGIGRAGAATGLAGSGGVGTTLTAIGSKFMDWGKTLFGTIKNVFQNGLLSYFPKFTGALSTVFTAIKTFGSNLLSRLPGMLSTGFNAIKTFSSNLLSKLPGMLSTIKTFSGNLLSNLPNMLTAIKTFSSNLLSNLPNMLTAIKTFGGNLLSGLPNMLTAIKTFSGNLLSNLPNMLTAIKTFSGNLLSGLTGILSSGYTAIKTFGGNLLSKLPGMLSSSGGVIGNAFTLLKTSIVDGLLPAMGRFGSSMLSFAGSIPGMLKNFSIALVALLKNVGSNMGSIFNNLGGLGGKLGKLGNLAKGAAVVAAGGFAVDAAFGAFGVGKGSDGQELKVDEKQDDINWEKATFWEKAQSGLARGIEKVGSLLFLDNMAQEAKASRIKKETEYLQKEGRLSTTLPTTAPVAMATPTTNTTTAATNLQTGLQGATATGPGLTTGGMISPTDPLASADMATKQILSYLSAITVDIAAIRGNTRPENATTAPVRLG